MSRTVVPRILALTPVLTGALAGTLTGQAHPQVSLVGLVRDSAGAPLGDIEITVDSSVVLVRSDTLGRFTVPGLAPGSHTLRFERPGLLPMRMRADVPGGGPEAALSLGEIVLRAAPERLLRVSIAFTDATSGRAVEGVVVSVGRRVAGYGNRQGRFRSDGVRLREGEEWSFRRLGYEPTVFELWPTDENQVNLAIKLKPIAITLGPVIVTGDVSRALTPWLKDFEERRRREPGTFLGEEDILKHRGSLSAVNLLSWAGVNVRGDVTSARSLRVWGACPWRGPDGGPPVIFLDGMRLEEQAAIDWLDMYAPEQIAGVEVYGHESNIPPMFNATGAECGVIAVWTKR